MRRTMTVNQCQKGGELERNGSGVRPLWSRERDWDHPKLRLPHTRGTELLGLPSEEPLSSQWKERQASTLESGRCYLLRNLKRGFANTVDKRLQSSHVKIVCQDLFPALPVMLPYTNRVYSKQIFYGRRVLKATVTIHSHHGR
ncbi:hypothetical protein F7725_017565 [Dissostichus mawsoni]|uniref:Uncharacterized protein n=1 Tax=Dissostichus mawsoni TaxID=36200 RepID=A0A7J5Z4T6_DISMA|nr:hypothetical protein F7725_017565 [Dissostichus mawsoni]